MSQSPEKKECGTHISSVAQFGEEMRKLFVGTKRDSLSIFLHKTLGEFAALKNKEEKKEEMTDVEQMHLRLGELWTANWLALQTSR